MAPPGFEHWRASIPHGHPYHPWGWHAHRFGRFGFGRRLFWFGFGAIAAMAWARHHGGARMSVEGEGGRGERDGSWNAGSCRRVEYSARLVPEDQKQGRWGWGHGWHHRRRDELHASEASFPASIPAQAVAVQSTPAPPLPPAGTSIPVVEQPWQADVRNYTQQASDRVSITYAVSLVLL